VLAVADTTMTNPRGAAPRQPDASGLIVVIDHEANGPLERAIQAAIDRTQVGSGLRVVAGSADALPRDKVKLLVASAAAVDAITLATVAGHGALVATGAVMKSGQVATPVDTLAWLRSGARGVIESSALVLPETIALVLQRPGQRVLLGEPAARFQKFHERVVDDWPSDDEGDRDPLCFRAAMALAQIEVLRPAPSRRRNYGFVQLAIGLNGHHETTAFSYNTNDLRRALARLARLWTPDDEVDAPIERLREELLIQRIRLPAQARDAGFPVDLPILPGLERSAVSGELYRALQAANLETDVPIAGLARAYVRIRSGSSRPSQKGASS
jgi:hypothetical protein